MTRILTQSEVRSLLPMRDCMDAMEHALRSYSSGESTNPLRWPMRVKGHSHLVGMMPGATDDPATLGLKIVGIFPQNHGTRFDSHQGVVLLFDPQNGIPLCIADASEVTAIRTAAVSGVATRLLARSDARRLGILGSGVQATTHLEAMCSARPIEHVSVFSPTKERVLAFAERARATHGIQVDVVDDPADAVRGCDIVCTTTSAREPVLRGEWLAEGTHINAAGACTPNTRELDAAAVARSRVWVDSRESAAAEAGDLLLAHEEAAFVLDDVAGELGEILGGRAPGRANDGEITLFESLGLAVEDLVATQLVYERAQGEGVGSEVALGGIKP